MKKKLVISALAMALTLSVVSCGDNDDVNDNVGVNTSDALEVEDDDSTSNAEGDLSSAIEVLNTNEDDIRALDFYSVEVSESEASIQPMETMINDTEFTQLDAPVEGDIVAIIQTSEGIIKVKFLPEVAPKAVKNFVEHALNDYYDGITFHRVIDGFVAQGGDPTATGMGGDSIWGTDFVNEISVNARHFSGALAMANSNNNASNGSQFYFVDEVKLEDSLIAELDYMAANPDEYLYEGDDAKIGDYFTTDIINGYKENGGTPFLDFGYTVFGQVYEGLDVVDAITQVEVDASSSKPVENVVIEDIIIGIYK